MKRLAGIIFFILATTAGFSQRLIKGRVVNAATGDPVPGSSVFITNTSKGTTSNNAGIFELHDVPPGKHELIISCIGYETNVFPFSDDQLPLQLKVELNIKVKEMENVTVEPSVEEGWDKWGRSFMENFVGNSANASKCNIKNEKEIKFRYYKKSSRLIAYCDGPVILENKALGYTISYQLENFEVNFDERSVTFLGYSLFTPFEDGGKSKSQKWDNNREEAYNGSIMHFMRSLYANRLLEEGFEVRRMKRSPNYEKQRVANIYRVSLAKRSLITGPANGDRTSEAGSISRDSMRYYEAVMRQHDNVETYGSGFLTADSLIIESKDDFKAIHFEDNLFITYKKELEESGYLRTQFPERKATFQRSYVTLLGEQIIFIDKSGNYYNPQEFFTSAYWGWSDKMANSLPLDYEPGK